MEKRLGSLDVEWLSKELAAYFNRLREFISDHEWVDRKFSIDHIGIKAHDEADYKACLLSIMPIADMVYEIEMNNRKLAIIVLARPLDSEGGAIRYIELMEPRPEKVGKDTVGLDHTEIYVFDFEKVAGLAEKAGEPYEYYDNGHHKALVFKIGEKNEEIKLSDTPMERVIEEELASGELKKIK
ncbi:MAG: VOC family protein [Candidatus Colwellbacteria bacterium]|nr:VOC family protein [Candidatus Colwellbacteria bacterium]